MQEYKREKEKIQTGISQEYLRQLQGKAVH